MYFVRLDVVKVARGFRRRAGGAVPLIFLQKARADSPAGVPGPPRGGPKSHSRKADLDFSRKKRPNKIAILELLF